MMKMLVITNGRGHLKMIEETGIAIRGQNPATMITTAPIVKYPWDTKKTTIKVMTAEIQDIATTTEKTRAATSNSSQEDQGNTISHRTTCSTGHAIYTTHSSTEKECHDMQ
jgi:hypothetical protein